MLPNRASRGKLFEGGGESLPVCVSLSAWVHAQADAQADAQAGGFEKGKARPYQRVGPGLQGIQDRGVLRSIA
jgi:hypothetical protein